MIGNSRADEIFKKANDEFNRTGKVSIELLKKLQKALDEDTKAYEDNTKEHKKFEDKSTRYTDTLVAVTKQLGSNLQSIRKNRESFTGLSGAVKTGIQAAGVAATATSKTVAAVAGTIGDVALISKHPAALIVGGIAKGVEWVADKSGEAARMAAQVAPVLTDFALKEIQDVVDSYQKLGSVGMAGAAGMTGLRENANEAGLSLKTYSAIMARNSQALAAVGGSTEAGADLIGKASKATENVKEEYLRLGFSFEEQEELAIKALDYKRRMGIVKSDNTKGLADGTKKYFDLVDDISRMTGMKRSQAAAILERQQSNLRFAMTQAAITEKMGGDTTIADNLSAVSAALSVHGGEALAKTFQDATAGPGTKAAQEFEMLTGGRGLAIIDRMKRGELTKEQALKEIHAATKAARAARGDSQFSEQAGMMGVVSDDALLASDRLAIANDVQIEALTSTKKSQEEAKNTQDKSTKDVTNAQKALRDFATGLDVLVSKEVLPRAATLTKEFTVKLKDFIDRASEELGVGKKTADIPAVPGAGSGTPPAPPGEAKKVEGKPDLTRITTPGGRSAEVNKDAAPAFQKLVNWLEDKAGYKINSLGGFADRDVRGRPGMKSVHAVGGAIDINPAQNPLGGSLVTDMPANISEVAKSLGLGWGGNWTSRKDAMHFSAATREGGSILKFAQGGVASGPKGGYDVMMHGTEAVVPLPNGTDVPISGGIVLDKYKEQLALFEQQGRFIDEMIIAVKNNNDANTRILAMKSS